MSIPLFELPEVRKAINPDLTEDACLRSISLWDPDYLLKRGLTPVEPQYSQWCGFQAHNQMRADRHPDLIVSAMGQGDGTVRVWTADGAEHIVTKASYKVTTLNLLSKCDILSHVPPKVEPEPETKVLSRDEALHLFGR